MWQDYAVNGDYIKITCHQIHPLVAAATSEGQIDLISEDSTRTCIRKDAQPCILQWHPEKRFLAASWSTGVVGIWCEQEQLFREGNAHLSEIMVLEWSVSGNRLVSADRDGQVVVWKVDPRGRMLSLCQYRLKGYIDSCLFRNIPIEKNESSTKLSECPSFFLGGENGIIYYADDMGHCSEVAQVSSSVKSMIIIERISTLIVIDSELNLYQFVITADDKLNPEKQVKLSAGSVKKEDIRMDIKQFLPGVLAYSFESHMICILDLVNEESSSLAMPGALEEGVISCIAFNWSRKIITGGCTSGFAVMWRMVGEGNTESESITWESLPKINVGNSIEEMYWGNNGKQLAIRTSHGVRVYVEHNFSWSHYKDSVAIQIGQNKLLINAKTKTFITTNIRFKGISLTSNFVAVYNGTSIEVYDYNPNKPTEAHLIGQYPNDAQWIQIDDNCLCLGYYRKVDICNHHGTVKQSISIPDEDGEVVGMDLKNGSLCVATARNNIRIYDITRREPKQPSGDFRIQTVKLNSNGRHVSFTGSYGAKQIEDFLYVLNVERDVTELLDLRNYGLKPVTHCWDSVDPRILVVETTSGVSNKLKTDTSMSVDDASEDRYLLSNIQLVGVNMPEHYFIKNANVASENEDAPQIEKRLCSDFIGITDLDPVAVEAITDFGFYLAIGNMDEALKAIKNTKSTAIWENMAKICVKSKRLDVAKVCLGNMGHIRALRAIRTCGEVDTDTLAGILALHLGMHSDAEVFFDMAGRYDFKNKYYQASDQWDKALDLACTKDRINLKNTYYNYGKSLEQNGDITGAIAAYEKSSVYSIEVPRMLKSLNNDDLENYIKSSDDKSLKKWWAQYQESSGNFPTALRFYESANDVLSSVRVHCFSGNLDQAILLAEKSGDPAAAYFIARQYENENKIHQAIKFYSQAKCFNHATRLAKENRMNEELMHLALQGSSESMIDAARYYESTANDKGRAINLYYKGGNLSKAIELCFQTKQFNALVEIAHNLTSDTDPALLQQCADFFAEHEQHAHSVRLLVKAKKFDQALALCLKYNIPITEELADSFEVNTEDNVHAKEFLIQVADCCMNQQNYHLACKKYTQGGDRVKAMRALLKSGDTEKIIFFANVSGPKNNEIFVLAAHYLQTLDWRNDPNVMKALITFYTKAKAMESLAGFYKSCAQVEVDEYQNYEKAYGALKEAMKCVSKAKQISNREEKLEFLQRRIDLIGKFVEARSASKTDKSNMMKICEELLSEKDIDDSVRTGDIYGLMIETNFANGFHEKAAELLQTMRMKLGSSKLNLEYYVDPQILNALQKRQNLEFTTTAAVGGEGVSDTGIEEELDFDE
ncbi:hypothetical protein HK098_001719 [Nowakowskiella sp. JEL0407]|nr:hypothetical protein HK098_001719 [Nowakowskiella sp. JEL0407]